MTDTVFTSIQVSQLVAVVTGGGFKRAAKKDIAVDRLVKALAEKIGAAAAEHTAKLALAAADVDAARLILRAAIDPDIESEETEDRPGDTAEVAFEANGATAEAGAPKTKPAAPPKTSTPKAEISDKPWYRDADAVDAAMRAAMRATGPAKLGAFRAKIIEVYADFAALSLTQQNGVLIRSINRMMGAGMLTKDGLIFGLKEAVAEAA